MSDFHRILPCAVALAEKAEKDRGWRYRVSRDDGEGRAMLFEEQVWPEKLTDPKANHIRAERGRISIRVEEARWLRDTLDDLISAMEAEDDSCTGITARWCPRCGDCRCAPDPADMDEPSCPLHGIKSDHAESSKEQG